MKGILILMLTLGLIVPWMTVVDDPEPVTRQITDDPNPVGSPLSITDDINPLGLADGPDPIDRLSHNGHRIGKYESTFTILP